MRASYIISKKTYNWNKMDKKKSDEMKKARLAKGFMEEESFNIYASDKNIHDYYSLRQL